MDKQKLAEADWLFRKMVRKFIKERDRVLIEGITLTALLVLHKIVSDGAQRLGDLAEQLDFTSGAITALCDKLEEKGFALRRRGEDRRAVLLDITEQGREMVRRNRNIDGRCISVLFEGFSEEELAAQIKAYQKIFDNLKHYSEDIIRLPAENTGQTEATRQIEKNEPAGVTNKFFTYSSNRRQIMKITVNGNEVIAEKELTVDELLVVAKVEMPEYVTVQVNDELVDRENFSTTLLKDGDAVEFLYFMGGGQI